MGRSGSEHDARTAIPAVDPARLRRLRPERRIPGRNATKADILVYRWDEIEVAVKDYGGRAFLVRNTLGRALVRREVRSYLAAAGIGGVPRFLGRVGPFALATEFVRGKRLADLAGQPVPAERFARLGSLVDELHRRGIALGDLHHRDVVLADDGGVYVVDLATAWVLGDRPGVLRRAVFRRMSDLDRIAVARMRARWTGGDPGEAAREVAGSTATWHRRGRKLKALWDRLRRRP